MAKYVISYRAPKDYVPGREDDMAEWAALTLRYESPRDAQASKTPGSASRSGSWRRCRANSPSADRPSVSPAAPAS